ncbi:hypothetical protein ACFLS1_12150 [Verrucomicrobiota bacterium]
MIKDLKIAVYKSPKTVFRLRDISILTGDTNFANLKAKLNYYVSKNVIMNPRKGIYVKEGYSREELACCLYTPSYISLETVLQKEGIIFQYSDVVTSVSYLARAVTIDGRSFSFRKVKKSILVSDAGIRRKNNVNIAGKERALLDTLYLNKNFYFDNVNKIDKKKVRTLLRIYNSRALEKRTERLLNHA